MNTPDLIESIIDSVSGRLRLINPDEIDVLQDALVTHQRIFLAGKGRTGLQLQGFGMRLMHCGLKVHIIGEVSAPSLQPDDLLIIGSGSGRTASLLGYAEKAKRLGATLATITGNLDSPIAQAADMVIHIQASNSKAGKPQHMIDNPTVLPMGSLFEHTCGLLCDLIIIQLMEKIGVSERDMEHRHANLE